MSGLKLFEWLSGDVINFASILSLPFPSLSFSNGLAAKQLTAPAAVDARLNPDQCL